ncbi:acyl carrier protein [Streptomyces sp. NBC_01092]|uniref:acyl carrier protein n=1 Tax=Streptomyces sp. NBC_01092 TaxID=2903748 RepID=UPI00386DFC67|nr:acyl carrier protein [Streptomyces sp. NBC_01092]
MSTVGDTPQAETVSNWLTGAIAEYASLPPEKVDPDVPISDYGLDSVSVIAMVTQIEDAFHVVPDVTALWDHPTIRELAAYLAELIETERSQR